jgi:three-Cys-motif partner protein
MPRPEDIPTPERHPPDKPVEERDQTRHKLETMVRYWGGWLEVSARARGSWCNRHLWLVDGMAGSGRHPSTEHPDAAVPGTAVIAAIMARTTQRAHPGQVVTVHAVDIDPSQSTALEGRLAALRGEPPEGVDVRVHPDDFADVVDGIIAEVNAPCAEAPSRTGPHQHHSLWLMDPYGPQAIPIAPLRKVESLAGSELIINLDTHGVARLMAVARSRRGPWQQDAAILDALFGSDIWTTLPEGEDEAVRDQIARTYADRFTRFPIRRIHRMRASSGQIRHFIHLSRHTVAEDLFKRVFDDALVAGTIAKGKTLSLAERSAAAARLAGEFAGQRVTVDEMALLSARSPKGQLPTICRTAEADGWGTYEAGTRTMTWFSERARGLFD